MHISTLWLFIGGEVFLVLALALGILLISRVSQRRRDRKAAMYLVGIIKENEAQRLEQTKEVLSRRFGLGGEGLEKTTHAVIRAEKLLYQRIINMYVKRDVISLREMNIDVEANTEPFRNLEGPDESAPSADLGDIPGSEHGGNVDALRAENQALKQELQITMETMSRMLDEYASMFGGGPQEPPQAHVMGQMIDEGQTEDKAYEAEDAMETTEEGDDADLFAMDDGIEGLEEIQGFDLDEASRDSGHTSPEPAGDQLDADATVVTTPPASEEIDMADEDLDDIFAPDHTESERKPILDENGEPIDDELADIWADALNEQESEESKRK